MIVGRQHTRLHVKLEGEELEQISEFTYLED
jgi:hypothetical protein